MYYELMSRTGWILCVCQRIHFTTQNIVTVYHFLPRLPMRTTIKDDRQALWLWINPCISSAGNSMGGLRAYGPQVLHGNGPDPAGGPGPVGHRQRLVQVVPYLLSGRPQHRPAHETPLAVLAGERHQPIVHLDNPTPAPTAPQFPAGPPTCKLGHMYCKYTAAVFEFAGQVRSVHTS